MKRATAPFYWLPFGAGGMLAALTGVAMVYLTGIAGPGHLDYDRALAIARSLPGKVWLLAVVATFLWHAAHRLFHTAHDLGIPTGALTWAATYGVALVAGLVTAGALLVIGF